MGKRKMKAEKASGLDWAGEFLNQRLHCKVLLFSGIVFWGFGLRVKVEP